MEATEYPVGDPEGFFWDANQGCHENIQNLALVWFEIQKLLVGMSDTNLGSFSFCSSSQNKDLSSELKSKAGSLE